jgi:hypothetical protein
MTAKIIIYRPNGEVQKVIHDPVSWSFEAGVLTVTQIQNAPDKMIRTTLPYYIESTV